MGTDPELPEDSLEAIGLGGSEGYEPPERGRRVFVWIAGFLVVLASIVAFIVTVLLSGSGGGSPSNAPRSAPDGFVPRGGSPEQDARQITAAFLQAWQRGDLAQAAGYTSDPAGALDALAAYRRYLDLRKLTVTLPTGAEPEQSATAVAGSGGARETVQYTISAVVAASDDPHALTGTWRYATSLVAYQQPNSQVWTIDWAPDMLAPGLTDSTYPAAVEVHAEPKGTLDASGTDLRTYSDAGLNTIASDLQDQAEANAEQGTPGLAVQLQNQASQPVPGSETVLISPRAGPGLTTTIDPHAEAAASNAVHMYQNSSMVVIQPTTGKILAVANSGDQDNALTIRVAPGSTMKVITAAALINAGILSESSDVPCPAAYTVQGVTFHNDKGEEFPDGTSFITDFAQSCNNAFSTQWMHLSGLLASTAQTYFGLNQEWNIGLGGHSAEYFSVPPDADGPELAEEAFGEGEKLTASPLAMASVAATVDAGIFRQPYLLAGTQQQITATALPHSTDAQLWDMMHAVVTEGTAASVGFGPGVYAKTGTADVGQGRPDSWMIAFDGDVAVACLVPNAGYGAQYAGPEVKAFFDRY